VWGVRHVVSVSCSSSLPAAVHGCAGSKHCSACGSRTSLWIGCGSAWVGNTG
jgi:hypothetical protein